MKTRPQTTARVKAGATRQQFRAGGTFNGAILSDPQGRVVGVSPALAKTLGYRTTNELLGRQIETLFLLSRSPSENGRRLASLIQRVRVSGPQQIYLRIPGSEGSEFSSWVDVVRWLTPDNCWLVWTLYTVSTTASAVDDPNDATEHYRTVVENMTDGVCVFIPHSGERLFVNPALAAILGVTSAEFLEGLPSSHFENLEDMERIRRNAFRAIRGHSHENMVQCRIRRPSGEARDIEVQINKVHVRGEAAILTVTRDTTDQKRSEEASRELANKIVEIQEQERAEIARELHDDLGSGLSALKINIERILLTGDLTSLTDAKDVLEELLEKTRSLSLKARPVLLDELGLVPSLAWLSNRLLKQAGLQVQIIPMNPIPRVSWSTEIAAFRIVQEALNNTIRHSGAKRARVRIRASGGVIRLVIEDNGHGFDRSKLAASGSLGLKSMEERAMSVGGRLEVVSSPYKGTRVITILPIAQSDPP